MKLYPPPAPAEEKDEKDSDDDKSGNVTMKDEGPMRSHIVCERPRQLLSGGPQDSQRALVDLRASKTPSPDELNRTAEHVINSLKRDLKPAQ